MGHGEPFCHDPPRVRRFYSDASHPRLSVISPGESITQAIALIQACRSAIGPGKGEAETHIHESLENVEEELGSRQPKKSKLLAYIDSATKYVAAGTTLATFIEQLKEVIHKIV